MAVAAAEPAATAPPPEPSPSTGALRWLIGLRLVVISGLFLGVLIIQVNTQLILQLRYFYGLILLSYGLSLGYLILHLQRLPTRAQAVVQLLGDLVVVTGFVYFTGGLYSPFSFLYLTVIVVAAVLLRGGGLIFAGLSAITYGALVDLMVFDLIPIPATLAGIRTTLSSSRVLNQIMIHVVGFVLVALLVSYLTESLRTTRSRLVVESERVRQYAALTDHVVRSVGAGILATDLEMRVLHVNPAGARILDISDPERVTGQPLPEVMPLDGHSWGLVCARVRDRSTVRFEATHSRTGLHLGMTAGPLADETDAVVGFIVNFQDLSEVEIQLEQQRMRERMAAVGEMASRMAHEIKNPLASISGSAQVLATVGGLDDTSRRLLDIVVDESRRLSTTLDGFLDYTRPQRTSMGLCDLGRMLSDCVDLLRRSAEVGDRHTIRLDAPEELVIQGQEALLRQLFWNLSRNAIQAMPDGGRLSISAARRDDQVTLEWRDTGVGMTDEVRLRAFEPFVTTRPDGTGLGLAVVYAAVQEHGGSVDVDSAPGAGTRVVVELPLEQENR